MSRLLVIHYNDYYSIHLTSDAVYFQRSYFGGSPAIAILTSLRCSGSENRLVDCGYTPTAHTECGENGHAGVRCIGIVT